MIRIKNTSDTLQVIPGKNGAMDLPVGGEDRFNVAADNPHVDAKVRAGLIAIVPDEAEAASAPEADKPEGRRSGGKGSAEAKPDAGSSTPAA